MKEMVGEQIRNEYETIYNGVNGKAYSMLIDEAVKRVNGFVKFTNGKIFVFPKRYITTYFIFYYDSNKTSSLEIQTKERFFEVNLESLEKMNDIINGRSYGYSCNPSVKDSNLVYVISQNFLDEHYAHSGEKPESIFELNLFDKILFERELEVQKIMFKKRLETYWKKYGTSKLDITRATRRYFLI